MSYTRLTSLPDSLSAGYRQPDAAPELARGASTTSCVRAQAWSPLRTYRPNRSYWPWRSSHSLASTSMALLVVKSKNSLQTQKTGLPRFFLFFYFEVLVTFENASWLPPPPTPYSQSTDLTPSWPRRSDGRPKHVFYSSTAYTVHSPV